MSDLSSSRCFFWWGITLILEFIMAALLWRATEHLGWGLLLRIVFVWFFGAALALLAIAVFLKSKELFRGIGNEAVLRKTRVLHD